MFIQTYILHQINIWKDVFTLPASKLIDRFGKNFLARFDLAFGKSAHSTVRLCEPSSKSRSGRLGGITWVTPSWRHLCDELERTSRSPILRDARILLFRQCYQLCRRIALG